MIVIGENINLSYQNESPEHWLSSCLRLLHSFRFICIVCALCCISTLGSLLLARAAHAESGAVIPDSVVLDGVTYSQKALAGAFVESAFSTWLPVTVRGAYPQRTLLPPMEVLPENQGDPLYSAKGYKAQYPWLYEYIYRDKGTPRYVALNKWAMPDIRVSIGFPNDLKPIERAVVDGRTLPEIPLFEAFTTPVSAEVEALVQQQVESLSLIIKAEAGLSVSYLPHRKETASNWAQVRIVIYNRLHNWKTLFKRGNEDMYSIITNLHISQPPRSFRDHIEKSYLPTAVHFTPNTHLQVDGFFLSDAHNNIETAFCFISADHREDIFQALVRECLLRSMGLPEAPYQPPSMLLSFWNDAQRFMRHGETAPERPSDLPWPPQITEFDRYMLKTLYDPRMRPGMSPAEVYKNLVTKN